MFLFCLLWLPFSLLFHLLYVNFYPLHIYKSCQSVTRTFHFISSYSLLNFPLSYFSSMLWVSILLHGHRFCLPLDLKSLCQTQPFCPLFPLKPLWAHIESLSTRRCHPLCICLCGLLPYNTYMCVCVCFLPLQCTC